jgi:ABC-2 type transport system permease protein
MKQIAALYLAQAREFLRDRMSVLFVLLLPVAFGVFFGLVFSGGGGFTLQLGVVNEDAGPAGAKFVEGLQTPEASKGIDLRSGARDEMLAALDKAELHAVVILPEDMTVSLTAGETVAVEVFYDSSRVSSAGVALGMVRTLLNEANLAISGAPRLLEMREQAVQTHPFRSVDFYMPGMLGVALMWLGAFGTAQPVIAQREAQVLRRFSVTPISRATMLAAEVSWRVTVGLLQTATFLFVGYFGFQVGVKDWLLFIATILLGTLVFVSMGYVIAGVARSAESGMAIAQLTQFPMMMLSGSIFSADFLPSFFQPVVAIMPLTYLSDLLRQTMVGMSPMHPMALDFAVLGGWLVVMMALAARLWRWE